MLKLTGLTLEGFMSFSADFSQEKLPGLPGRGSMTNRLAFDDVTVLVGPNGAGKSNVVSFFRMLTAMMSGIFQEFVARSGYADSILHYGTKKTPAMRVRLEAEDREAGTHIVDRLELASAKDDALIFVCETALSPEEVFLDQSGNQCGKTSGFQNGGLFLGESPGTGYRESILCTPAPSEHEAVLAIANILRRYRFYHFHDTSAEAGIRRSGYIEDAYSLRSDAGNLAAFLYGLKCRTEMEPYYRRIENTIRLAFPQFREFVLAPRVENKEYIRLNWYSRASEDYLLGPHQLSDGALRFAALATLLLQPPDRLPALIVLDEPELGLHPVAIALLAEMIKGVALQQAQVLVATQSPQLVDQFDLGRIRPIEHRSGRSVILELDPEAYKDWLDEYSTGELWEKNIIGGGPTGG